jgi:hypothetical protein
LLLSSGGTLVSELVKLKETLAFDVKIFAAVRSQSQVDALSNLGTQALLVDMSNGQAASGTVVDNDSTPLPKYTRCEAG